MFLNLLIFCEQNCLSPILRTTIIISQLWKAALTQNWLSHILSLILITYYWSISAQIDAPFFWWSKFWNTYGIDISLLLNFSSDRSLSNQSLLDSPPPDRPPLLWWHFNWPPSYWPFRDWPPPAFLWHNHDIHFHHILITVSKPINRVLVPILSSFKNISSRMNICRSAASKLTA